MVVASGIGIFHTDDMQIMRPAYFIFLFIPVFYNIIFKMFLSVQFNCQNRNLLLFQHFIYDKIKTPAVKQIAVIDILRKYMGNCHLFIHLVCAL